MNTTPQENTPNQATGADGGKMPVITISRVRTIPDWASILGLIFSFALIVFAISISPSDANFFNIPSFLIVCLGTITATSVSFTTTELLGSGRILSNGFARQERDYKSLAIAMMELATLARKRGVLALSAFENQTRNEPFLGKSIQLAVDGFNPADVERILVNEIDADLERNKRGTSMLRRGAEIAPTMGLIGTLVGLVQMLADLENPETIGPAMAVALLTTFYGAILGSVVLAPLAAKLEKNAADTFLIQTLSMKTALSILRQENPRNLEHVINSLLPPSQRIVYFD